MYVLVSLKQGASGYQYWLVTILVCTYVVIVFCIASPFMYFDVGLKAHKRTWVCPSSNAVWQ